MARIRLEAHTRTLIDWRLQNLGWILDRNDPRCNVYLEQAKTQEQNKISVKINQLACHDLVRGLVNHVN